MKRWNLYTPEGVQDILFDQCKLKRKLEADLRQVFTKNGFLEAETPTIEFYDVFGGERGLIKQESMYKFCDSKGRLLVLRPDMTVPVARMTATKIKEENWPLKCCYLGNSFCFDELGGGRLNEYTQAGLEILGVNTPEADAEVVAMAVKALKAAGIEEFQIDIGQVAFFMGLMEESGLTPEEVEEVRELIDLKDFVGVEQVMNRHQVDDEVKRLILDLPRLFGSKSVLMGINQDNIGQKASGALNNLRTVIEILEDKGLSQYVSIDLGMVQSLNYYTGIVFRGYTYGVGFPVLSGGRYDSLVEKFGKDCPATGFSLGVNMVLMALERQSKAESSEASGTLVIYGKGARKAASDFCESLTESGEVAELDITMAGLDKCVEYARSRGYIRVVQFEAGQEPKETKL